MITMFTIESKCLSGLVHFSVLMLFLNCRYQFVGLNYFLLILNYKIKACYLM